MSLQMVYPLIETHLLNQFELLKKMIKELEQNKEELRKMKESFDSKLEEMEKDNSWSRKVNPSGEVRVSFFFLNAWHWS